MTFIYIYIVNKISNNHKIVIDIDSFEFFDYQIISLAAGFLHYNFIFKAILFFIRCLIKNDFIVRNFFFFFQKQTLSYISNLNDVNFMYPQI